MVLNWVPAEWARPDSALQYPSYYLRLALSFLSFVAFIAVLVPVVVVVAVSAAVAVIAIAVPGTLFLFGASITPRLVGDEEYQHLEDKHDA